MYIVLSPFFARRQNKMKKKKLKHSVPRVIATSFVVNFSPYAHAYNNNNDIIIFI